MCRAFLGLDLPNPDEVCYYTIPKYYSYINILLDTCSEMI